MHLRLVLELGEQLEQPARLRVREQVPEEGLLVLVGLGVDDVERRSLDVKVDAEARAGRPSGDGFAGQRLAARDRLELLEVPPGHAARPWPPSPRRSRSTLRARISTSASYSLGLIWARRW